MAILLSGTWIRVLAEAGEEMRVHLDGRSGLRPWILMVSETMKTGAVEQESGELMAVSVMVAVVAAPVMVHREIWIL